MSLHNVSILQDPQIVLRLRDLRPATIQTRVFGIIGDDAGWEGHSVMRVILSPAPQEEVASKLRVRLPSLVQHPDVMEVGRLSMHRLWSECSTHSLRMRAPTKSHSRKYTMNDTKRSITRLWKCSTFSNLFNALKEGAEPPSSHIRITNKLD